MDVTPPVDPGLPQCRCFTNSNDKISVGPLAVPHLEAVASALPPLTNTNTTDHHP